MAEKTQATTAKIHNVPQPTNNTITFRIPKPNMQVAILGLVAFITLFQTVQLVRISNSTKNVPSVQTVPSSTNTTTTAGTGSGSNASTPQSMVGGC